MFNNLDLRNYYVEIDGQRYPRDSVLIIYEEKDYIQQYKCLKLLLKGYIGEPILNLLISYPDMKTKDPIEIKDLKHQPHYMKPKKNPPFQDYGTDPDNARLFVILIRRSEIELISDGNKLIEVKVIKMKILIFTAFMKKFILKNETMNERELERVFNFNIYPRDSKILTDRCFHNTDNGSQGGTHWICFIVKDNKAYYFDSFGSQPDKLLLNQLNKPTIYHKYKIKDVNFKLCGSYCLYFFYLIERMIYHDAFLKMYFYKLR